MCLGRLGGGTGEACEQPLAVVRLALTVASPSFSVLCGILTVLDRFIACFHFLVFLVSLWRPFFACSFLALARMSFVNALTSATLQPFACIDSQQGKHSSLPTQAVSISGAMLTLAL